MQIEDPDVARIEECQVDAKGHAAKVRAVFDVVTDRTQVALGMEGADGTQAEVPAHGTGNDLRIPAERPRPFGHVRVVAVDMRGSIF